MNVIVSAKSSVKNPDAKKVRYSFGVEPKEEGRSGGKDSDYLKGKGIKEGK
jgi:hypothetical protein